MKTFLSIVFLLCTGLSAACAAAPKPIDSVYTMQCRYKAITGTQPPTLIQTVDALNEFKMNKTPSSVDSVSMPGSILVSYKQHNTVLVFPSAQYRAYKGYLAAYYRLHRQPYVPKL